MARNDTIILPQGVWTQLTNANASALRVQNLGGYTLQLQATAGAVAPTSISGAVELRSGETLSADLTLAQLWPGVTGANRVYAISDVVAPVSVSHADG